jgi:hypothetical protein
MYTSNLIINGELFDVTAISQPFTHEVESGFMNDLGAFEVVSVEIGQSLGEGLFTASIRIKSEVEPTVDNLSALLEEYPDADVVSFMTNDSGTVMVAGGQKVQV